MATPLHPTAAAQVQAELADAWHSVADVLPPENTVVEARYPAEYNGWYAGLATRSGSRWLIALTGVELRRTPTHWREVR